MELEGRFVSISQTSNIGAGDLNIPSFFMRMAPRRKTLTLLQRSRPPPSSSRHLSKPAPPVDGSGQKWRGMTSSNSRLDPSSPSWARTPPPVVLFWCGCRRRSAARWWERERAPSVRTGGREGSSNPTSGSPATMDFRQRSFSGKEQSSKTPTIIMSHSWDLRREREAAASSRLCSTSPAATFRRQKHHRREAFFRRAWTADEAFPGLFFVRYESPPACWNVFPHVILIL